MELEVGSAMDQHSGRTGNRVAAATMCKDLTMDTILLCIEGVGGKGGGIEIGGNGASGRPCQ